MTFSGVRRFRLPVARVSTLVCLLAVAVIVSTLPGPTAVAVPAAAGANDPGPPGLGRTECFLGHSEMTCPTVLSPAELVPPATMTGLRPETRDALQAFSDQAVDAVRARYDLPETDRAAILSHARYDALAELWALIVESFETPRAQRSVRQQAVVDWLGRRMRYLRMIAPPYAAIEYAKFAGKNVNALEQLLFYGHGGTEQEIKDFLTGTPEPFDRLDTANATGGYCRYRPPAPFTDEFDGHTLQSCFKPCQNVFGCAPTTPGYDKFVQWANSRLGSLFDDQTVGNQAAMIAGSTMAAGAVAGTAAAQTLITMGTTIFPFATATGALTVFSVAAIASVPAIVLAALAIAVVAGINVATIEEMPGKLARAIAQSREPVDADALWATSEGRATLYTLFVDAVSPAPRADKACDNARVDAVWQSWSDGTPIRVFAWELADADFRPCLNPTPIAEASDQDPHFMVTREGDTTPTTSPSITFAHPDPDTTTTLRVRGDNWFVARPAGGPETQTLHINLTDWEGRTNLVWLGRTPDGYEFHGVRAAPDGRMGFDPDDCGTCWTDDELRYVGADGVRRTARIALHQAATGSPTYTADALVTEGPITFDANGFAPADAVGEVTYTWRFQKAGCGDFPCTRLEGPRFEVRPVFLDPEPGAVVTHARPESGAFVARVEATDSAGQTVARELVVRVDDVAPTVSLARDCAVLAVKVACNNHPVSAGDETTVFGGVRRWALGDVLDVRVDWGDGTGSHQVAGTHTPVPGSEIKLSSQPDQRTFHLNARHTYDRPGLYTVTVSAWNQSGGSHSQTLVLSIAGKQQVSFTQPEDQRYGDELVAPATGDGSGQPVTYRAGPDDVCRADGPNGSRIVSVGVGTCTVTAGQAAAGDGVWLEADPVTRRFEVRPAPLTVTAQDATITYGEPMPDFTASVEGLRNGDTRADLGELVVTGPPNGSDAGRHDLVPSGAASPNYDITLVDGTLTVDRAPMTVTPEDQSRLYGGDLPAYTFEVEGLVNGDTVEDIDGVELHGADKAAHVGSYDIVASSADNPNYDYTYRTGTETVTRAPLTITADDVARRYGETVEHRTSYDGLVNGDGPGAVKGLQIAGAPATADVGEYSISLRGGESRDYDITLVDGTERVRPAPLRITADDRTRRYGAPSPAYTATFEGLTNGDERSDVPGLTLSGPPRSAGAGTYPIKPGGATNRNYEIDFVDGSETVTKAPLTVTAGDTTRLYGSSRPKFTLTYDGLVNGDTPAAITGVGFDAAPVASDVGRYPVLPHGATTPDYDVTYVAGTETITRAPLQIRALDATVRYGARGSHGWTGVGWVNGDSDAGIATAPRCTATQGTPGRHVGAITCTGAADPNYAISYGAGTLTVNPLIRLDQTGLPPHLPRRASLDRRIVTLPTGDVEVDYGTGHAYSFPPVVVGRHGGTWLTRTPAFSGPVAANVAVTAEYTTMRRVIADESARGRIGAMAAQSLRSSWAKVRRALLHGGGADAEVERFAREVRRRTGQGIDVVAAQVLIAYAQLAYTRFGGRGRV